MLEAFVFSTVLCGFFGALLKRNLLMKIVSMDVMSTGVISCYVLVASHTGFLTPILSKADLSRVSSLGTDGLQAGGSPQAGQFAAYADPVPQAIILTAIVIGFSIQALMLVGVMKLARDNPTLEADEIERSHQP